jgi:hypothetical protein
MDLPFTINKFIEECSFTNHYITEQIWNSVNSWHMAIDQLIPAVLFLFSSIVKVKMVL